MLAWRQRRSNKKGLCLLGAGADPHTQFDLYDAGEGGGTLLVVTFSFERVEFDGVSRPDLLPRLVRLLRQTSQHKFKVDMLSRGYQPIGEGGGKEGRVASKPREMIMQTPTQPCNPTPLASESTVDAANHHQLQSSSHSLKSRPTPDLPSSPKEKPSAGHSSMDERKSVRLQHPQMMLSETNFRRDSWDQEPVNFLPHDHSLRCPSPTPGPRLRSSWGSYQFK